jgi:hypothetical protein
MSARQLEIIREIAETCGESVFASVEAVNA